MAEVEVVVVGSCNMDLVSYVQRLPAPGETVHGTRFETGFGGKGANQCVMVSRMGGKAAMVAKVGVDNFGDGFLNAFRGEGINIDQVTRTDRASTGVAPIAVEASGQNAIVIVSGANLLLTADDVDRAEELIKRARVVVCQLEIDPLVTLHALKLAKKHGVTTILNPAPAPATELDSEFYQYTDIFCPNEHEVTGASIAGVSDASEAAKSLLQRGCQVVIVTLGDKGCVVASRDLQDAVHVPAEAVQVVDTTGAGDAFVGALAFYEARYRSLRLIEKVARACAIATMSVQAPGTQKSYPRRPNIPDRLFEESATFAT